MACFDCVRHHGGLFYSHFPSFPISVTFSSVVIFIITNIVTMSNNFILVTTETTAGTIICRLQLIILYKRITRKHSNCCPFHYGYHHHNHHCTVWHNLNNNVILYTNPITQLRHYVMVLLFKMTLWLVPTHQC